MTKPVQGWGTALDGAEGEVAAYLESRGAKRSERGGAAFHRMPSQRVKHHAALSLMCVYIYTHIVSIYCS